MECFIHFLFSLSRPLSTLPHTQKKQGFTKKGSIVISNVKGPPAVGERARALAGFAVTDVVVLVPQTGDLSASFGLFSFAGKVQLSLAADESLVEDPRRMVELLREAFEELERIGEKSGGDDDDDDGGGPGAAVAREEKKID